MQNCMHVLRESFQVLHRVPFRFRVPFVKSSLGGMYLQYLCKIPRHQDPLLLREVMYSLLIGVQFVFFLIQIHHKLRRLPVFQNHHQIIHPEQRSLLSISLLGYVFLEVTHHLRIHQCLPSSWRH